MALLGNSWEPTHFEKHCERDDTADENDNDDEDEEDDDDAFKIRMTNEGEDDGY